MLAVAAGVGLLGTEPVSIAHTASSEQACVAASELSLPLALTAAAAAAAAAVAAALTGELIAVALAVASAAGTGSAGKLADCLLSAAVVAVVAAGAVGARFLRCQNLALAAVFEPACCFLPRASTY
jgi:hypothetical protein